MTTAYPALVGKAKAMKLFDGSGEYVPAVTVEPGYLVREKGVIRRVTVVRHIGGQGVVLEFEDGTGSEVIPSTSRVLRKYEETA